MPYVARKGALQRREYYGRKKIGYWGKEGDMMFWKKRKEVRVSYNPEQQVPVVKCSICTGEQVAGLKDISTGKFQEVMLIAGKEDLDAFCKRYGVDEVKKEY